MKVAILLAALACATPACAQQAPAALFSDITGAPQPIPVLERQAAQGDALAMTRLGLAKLIGERTPLDLDGAVRLLRAAAEKGNPAAATALGALLESGYKSIAADPAEGVRWVRFAYDHAEEPRLKGMAADLLGFAYGRTGGVGRDPAESRRWYRLGAEAGNLDAMGWYGVMLVGAIGGPKDVPGAVPWLQRAADGGVARAMTLLALMYGAGEGVPKDETRSIELLRRAADLKDGHAAMLLAAHYYLGASVPRDMAQAFHYATVAGEAGDKDGATMLTALYRMGDGTPVDLDAAERWGLKAAERGSARGMYELAQVYAAKRDEAKTVYWVRRAAESGDPDAMFIDARMLENGTSVPRDRDAAIAMYRAAAAKGDSRAREALARLGVTP